MKKKVVFWSVCLVCLWQTTLHGQDTVRYMDPHYLVWPTSASFTSVAHTAHYSEWEAHVDEYGDNIGLCYGCKYVPTSKDSVVYGVALTAEGMPERGYSPLIGLERAVSECLSGLKYLEMIDSATMGGVLRRRFYDYGPGPAEAPCGPISTSYEFYFETPHLVSDLPDTIYVTAFFKVRDLVDYYYHHLPRLLSTVCRGPDSAAYIVSAVATPAVLDTNQIHTIPFYKNTFGCAHRMFFNTSLGPLFPIVKLRCSMPSLKLVELGDGTATVKWRQNEDPEAYQLDIRDLDLAPNSSNVITPTNDSVHTFTGLADGRRYGIWVRKACRYATTQYDTLVWSEWSVPVTFYATSSTGVGEVSEADGLKIYSRPGTIVVESDEGLPEVRVYDMLGREVASTPASEATRQVLTVPTAGVYVVRAGERSHRRVVVLR